MSVVSTTGGGDDAALAGVELSVPPGRPWEGPALELDSLRRTLAVLAAGYDTLGPRKVDTALKAAEAAMRRVFAEDGTRHGRSRDAGVTYARLLVVSATVNLDTAHYSRAVGTAEHAAAVALEAGDEPTAAQAWALVSGTLRITGRPHHALLAARRSHSYAGRSPAAVMALLEEALAGAQTAKVDADTVLDAVTTAEEEHAGLPPEAWGTPGCPLGTYHPADLKTFAGSALVRAGLHGEAAPRLREAADILAGSPS